MYNGISKVGCAGCSWPGRNFNPLDLLNLVSWRQKINVVLSAGLALSIFMLCGCHEKQRGKKICLSGCEATLSRTHGRACPWWLRLMTLGVLPGEPGEGSYIWVKNQQSPLKRLWIKVLLLPALVACVFSITPWDLFKRRALSNLWYSLCMKY